ncbi:MAG: alpha/beta hydrolase [Phycisphaerales bacterium]
MDWIGLAQVLALGLALVWAMTAARIAWVLTRPPRRTLAFAVSRGWAPSPQDVPATLGGPRGFEEWLLRLRGRDLPVWDIPGDGGPGAPIVIFTHGWAESRLHGLWRLEAWLPAASRIVLWDLPGHGEAPGTCRLGSDEHLDLLALVDRVLGDEGRDGPGITNPPPIILHGFSLGAGVSIVAAAVAGPERVAAVVAEAPYGVPQTPARAVMHHAGLGLPLARAAAQGLLGLVWGEGLWWATAARAPRFDRGAWAARLKVPLLVLHGQADQICPPDDGRAIAGGAKDGRFVALSDAAHLDLWMAPQPRAACIRAVRDFIIRSSG